VDADSWNAYSKALQYEYPDPWKDATAFNQLLALHYKGHIKVYLTVFWTLNMHARITGEALHSKVNVALLIEIIERYFPQNPCLFMEDKPFLVATYQVVRHWEIRIFLQNKKLESSGDPEWVARIPVRR